jgi:hypothetical protein
MTLNHLNRYTELTDGQFQLIGKIIIEYSNIDFNMDVIFCRLLMITDMSGRYVTNRMNTSSVIDQIKNVLKLHKYRYQNKIVNENMSSSIEELLKHINDNRNYRNKFAHFCWSRQSDETIFGIGLNGIVNYDKNGEIKDDALVLSLTELNEIYTSTYDLVNESSTIIENLPEIKEETIVNLLINQ